MTRLPPDQIYSVSGAPNRELDFARASTIVARFPSGILVITEGTRLTEVMEFSETEVVVDGNALLLEEVATFSVPRDAEGTADATGLEGHRQGIQVFRYQAATE